jgi:hypothetical protein
MTQATRSCKQNIVEASQASSMSKETEPKLTHVAQASLEELLEGYRDFLRTHDPGVEDRAGVLKGTKGTQETKGTKGIAIQALTDLPVWGVSLFALPYVPFVPHTTVEKI